MMRMQRLDDHHVNDFSARNSCAAVSAVVSGSGSVDHNANGPSVMQMMHRSRGGREAAVAAYHSAFASVDERAVVDRGKSAAKNSSGKNGHRHTKRSPSERRFKCEQSGCERMFFTRKDVKRHMVVHTGVRNFPCQFCQQRFGRKDHLVRHAKKSHNRDCRSSAPSYSLTQGQAAAATAAAAVAAAANAVLPFGPQSVLSAAHSHNKLSRQMASALLPPPLTSVPSSSACCSSSSSGQSPPVPQSGAMASLLLAQSQAGGSGVTNSSSSGGNYHSSSPSVQPAIGPDFSPSSGMMHHHQHHNPLAGSEALGHHSLSAGHAAQSHLSVSSVHHHSMSKSSFDANGYHHHPFLPVPSAGHFVSHSLINPFVANSSRSLYTSSSGAFSPAVAVGMHVDPHHHHHPPPPPHHPTAHHHPHSHHAHHQSNPASPHFPADNLGLPHFNQAFH